MSRSPRTNPSNSIALSLGAFACLAGGTFAHAGDPLPALLTIADVEAIPGTTVQVAVTIDVEDLIGSIDLDAHAGGLVISDVIYDGPLFDSGWDGWDTAPSESPSIAAACIFAGDQVTGFQQLFSMELTIPDDVEVGSFFDVDFTSATVTNYEFATFDVTVVPGTLSIIDGGACPGDLAGDDGMVGVADLLTLLAAWGSDGGPADLTGDGTVDVEDLVALLGAWGKCD